MPRAYSNWPANTGASRTARIIAWMSAAEKTVAGCVTRSPQPFWESCGAGCRESIGLGRAASAERATALVRPSMRKWADASIWLSGFSQAKFQDFRAALPMQVPEGRRLAKRGFSGYVQASAHTLAHA